MADETTIEVVLSSESTVGAPIVETVTVVGTVPVGPRGATGPAGADGAQGPQGDPGAAGADGEGVPVGGTTGQVLAKATATDFDTEWVDQSGGGAVDSVNAQTGVVVLDAADVGADPAGSAAAAQAASQPLDADLTALAAAGNSGVLAATTATFTTADETKLDGIAAGAEVNVQSDWSAGSGDAHILNKPTLGTLAAQDDIAVPGDITATGTPSATTFLRGDGAWATPAGGGSGVVESVVAGTNVDVDATDPANPIVSMEALVDADIPASIARDAEVAAAYQPLDADLTALAAAGNSATLAATTAAFTTADETKLDGIEAGATADQSAAEILAALLTVDGSGSGLDADLLDGQSSAAFETPAGAQAKADAKVTQTITNGTTATAPSEDAVFDALALKAPLASPALTGNPTAPTATPGDSDTSIATTAFVNAEILADAYTPGGTDVAIADGGTGASTAAAAFAALKQAASDTATGVVELATTAETETGTDATRAVTPDGLHDMTTLAGAAWFLDEDAMTSNSATKVPSQQSTKAYVDNEIVALDELAAGVRSDLNTGTPGFVAIDVDLANGKSGGDTLTGGTGSGEDLTLASTTHATRGTIFVQDPMSLFSEDKTNTTTTPVSCIIVPSTVDVTLNDTSGGLNTGNQVKVVAFNGTVLYDANAYLFSAAALFENTGVFKNVASEARTLAAVQGLVNVPTYTADGAAMSVNHEAVRDAPICGVANAGTLTVGAMYALVSGATVNTGATVTLRKGLLFEDSTGAGTVTTAIGVDIAALSDATTSIGIRNASTTVDTPSVATLSAVTSTITPNASTKRLNNTSGGSLTLDPTGTDPIIADGQDGQRLLLFNSSAQNVVLTDEATMAGSNLKLSATTITLGQRDSIELMYSSDLGQWIQIAQVNVL